jgi:hypothetical protein
VGWYMRRQIENTAVETLGACEEHALSFSVSHP